MTKPEFISAVAAEANVSKTEATTLIDAVSTVIIKSVFKEGDSLTIPGLGTFKQKQKAARTARNPRTGDTVNVPAKTALVFKQASNIGKD